MNLHQVTADEAMSLFRSGRLSEAKNACESILARDPSNFTAMHLAGVIAIQTGDFQHAISSLDQAITLNPNSAAARSNMGIALHEVRRFDAAISHFDAAIANNPRYVEAYYSRGLTLRQLGKDDAALDDFNHALKLRPQYVDAYLQRGLLHANTGRIAEALSDLAQAIALQPNLAAAHIHRGAILQAIGRHAEARSSFDRAVALAPEAPELYYGRACSLRALGESNAALNDYSRAVALRSDYAEAYVDRGITFQELGKIEEAIADYQQAIALRPTLAVAHYNLGAAWQLRSRAANAEVCFSDAIRVKPDFAEAFVSLGVAQLTQNKLDDALANLDRAISLQPGFSDAHASRGAVLQKLGKLDDAIASYDDALRLDPNHFDALITRGAALLLSRRVTDALDSCDRAIASNPRHPSGYMNRGNVLQAQQRYNEAIASYDRAIALKSDSADAYCNRGVAQQKSGQVEAAMLSYARAIAVDPSYVETYVNRAAALIELNQLAEAVSDLEVAYSLNSDSKFLLGTLIYTKLRLADWTKTDELIAQLARELEEGQAASAPFPSLVVLDSPRLHRNAAKAWAQTTYGSVFSPRPKAQAQARTKIRIGYYSADFYNHAVSNLIAGLFEAHDRSRFELVGFSVGPDKHDEMRLRISSAFETFLDVRTDSDQQIAERSRQLGIDVAVDLGGYTYNARTNIFVCGCAPIQVNYLGYPGTMAIPCYDYIIGDSTVTPLDEAENYSEKIVILPYSYQVNDSQRTIASRVFSRAEFGLPEHGFVFCCFNNSFKILPPTFDGWMQILRQVDGSVLWLIDDNVTAAENLRRNAERQGIDSRRLVFAPRIGRTYHLARHALADLFIDSLPYNAHTTASDALWAGLPVLTLEGKSFPSRVAASLLRTLGLPELITSSQGQFEARAVQLASDPGALAAIKEKLAAAKETSPLFDTTLFARHIEAAYSVMVERARAGLPPDHIKIEP